jgi:hypothetical protein
MAKEFEFDTCLRHPFTCIVAGPTQSGKTQFVLKLIRACQEFVWPPPQKIIWCFGCYQPAFNDVSDDVEFVEGLPSTDMLDPNRRTLLIIDDLMSQTDGKVTNLFTIGSHHKNASVIFIVQNLFHKNKHIRDISLNTQYMVLFKNPRDPSQMLQLARQIYPNRSKHLCEAFADATSCPHGYLLVDLKQFTPDELRLRTEIFPGENAYVYVYK